MNNLEASFQLDEFYLDLQNNGQNISQLPESDIKKNPFPGLRPFKTSEFPLFEGRNSQVQDILDRLKRRNFLAVIGSSGTGKSSLIRAGLLPQLYGGFLYSAGTQWNIAICRPGDDPLHNLAVSLSSVKCNCKEKEEIQKVYPVIYPMLIDSTFGLLEVNNFLKCDASEKNLLVIIDQFEEIFRYNQKATTLDNADGHFINLLLNATSNKESKIFVIITMRSEFLGDTVRYRHLPEAINAGQYLVPQLSSAQLRKVIHGPIMRAEKFIESELVELLINEIEQKLTSRENVDYLPVLQHALMQTYKHVMEKESNLITLQDYQDIGRMDESLSRHAEQVFNKLDEDKSVTSGAGNEYIRKFNLSKKQLIAKMIFQALTDSRSDFKGGRRPTEVNVLYNIARANIINASSEEVDEIIEVFRDEKVSFIMPSASTPLRADLKLDISHESLMRNWPRLSTWIEEEVEFGKLYRILNERRELYERDKDDLLSGKALTGIADWHANYLNNAAWATRYQTGNQQDSGNYKENQIIFEKNVKFLQESLSIKLAKIQRKKIRSAVIVSALTAIVLLLLFAYNQRALKKVGFAMAALASVDTHKNDTLALLTAIEAHEDISKNGSDRDSTGLKTASSKVIKLYQSRNLGAKVIEKKNYKIVSGYIFKDDSRVLVCFQRSADLGNSLVGFTAYSGSSTVNTTSRYNIDNTFKSLLYYSQNNKQVQKEWPYPAFYVENSELIAVCKPSSISFYQDTVLSRQIDSIGFETKLNTILPITSIKSNFGSGRFNKPTGLLISRGAQDVTYYDLITRKLRYFNINVTRLNRGVSANPFDDVKGEFLADGNILIIKDAFPKNFVGVSMRTVQIFKINGQPLCVPISFEKDFSNVAYNLSPNKKLFILNLPDKTLYYDGKGMKDFNDTFSADMDLKSDNEGNFLLHDKHKIHVFNSNGQRIYPNPSHSDLNSRELNENVFGADTIDKVFDFKKLVILVRVKPRGEKAAVLMRVDLDPVNNNFNKIKIDKVPTDLISGSLSDNKRYFIGCQERKTLSPTDFNSTYTCFNYSFDTHALEGKIQTNNSAIFLDGGCFNTISRSRESRTKYSQDKSQDRMVIFDLQKSNVHFTDNFDEIKKQYLPIAKRHPYVDSLKVIFYKKEFLEVI